MGDMADFRILSRMLDLINRERAKSRAPALSLSTQLCQAAQAHCADMAARGYFGERGPDGVDVADRVKGAGYRGKSAANLAMGPETPEEGVSAMLGDPTGRATLLDPAQQHLGVGKADDAWCVIFAAPLAAAAAPTPDIPESFLLEINRERERIGRVPLRTSEQLTQAAHAHAADMAKRGYVSSRSPDGTAVGDRARQGGYDGRVGACVLAGASSPAQAVSHWLKDEGNRNNLLHGEFRFLGGAHVQDRFVVVLGTPPLSANASVDLLSAVLELINRARARHVDGMGQEPPRPLALSEYLNQAAQEHARDMVVRDYCGVSAPGGEGLFQRTERLGFRGDTAAVFARGVTSAEAVVDTWLRVEADRKRLMSEKYTEAGIGVAESRWALLLGRPSAEAVTVTPELRASMLEALNIERARALVQPLVQNDRLNQAAQAHAEDMVRRDFSGSTNPDGEGPAQRVARVKYPYRSLIEFTSVDLPAAQKVVALWMQSAGHRPHLLSKDLVHVGIGVCDSRWSVLLSRPQ